jgi:hypothetical protein
LICSASGTDGKKATPSFPSTASLIRHLCIAEGEPLLPQPKFFLAGCHKPFRSGVFVCMGEELDITHAHLHTYTHTRERGSDK